MLQTLMVKLATNKEQHSAILETMHRFNEACNYIAEIAFKMGTANKQEIHKVIYYDVRDGFKLSAQLAVRAISKVSEAYKAVEVNQRIVACNEVKAVTGIEMEHSYKPLSMEAGALNMPPAFRRG